MKNLHLIPIPTDKPSRLFEILQFNFIFDNQNKYSEEYKKLHKYKNQHIYITSDKELKMGDWVYSVRHFVGKFGFFENSYQNECKKIILTTDQNLINDGVQAIDDDFLEWFVKNPSCESVEVNRDWGYPKIIIPSEENSIEAKQRAKNYMSLKGALEPKQEIELQDFDNADILDVLNMGNVEYLGNGDIIYNPNLFFIKRGNKWFMKTKEPKQETLEEAAEIFVKNRFTKQICNDESYPDIYASKEAIVESHILFAKWQAERMYSEAIEFAEWIRIKDFQTASKDNWIGLDMKYYTTEELFEQFKKK